MEKISARVSSSFLVRLGMSVLLVGAYTNRLQITWASRTSGDVEDGGSHALSLMSRDHSLKSYLMMINSSQKFLFKFMFHNACFWILR